MSTNINHDYIKLIQTECEATSLDPDLLCAIINHESSWNKNAVKYEQSFSYLWQPIKYADLTHTPLENEIFHQRISFGLSQLMGANFRWMGFDKPLYETLDPAVNIHYGVNFFKKRCDVHSDIKDKISSYNLGSPAKKPDGTYINQAYVDHVYGYYVMTKQGK